MRGLIGRGRWRTALLALLQLGVVANIFVPATHPARAMDRARRQARGNGQRVAAGRTQRAGNRGSGGEVIGHVDPYGWILGASSDASAAPAFQASVVLPPRFPGSQRPESRTGGGSPRISQTNRDVPSRSQGRAPPSFSPVLAA